MLKLSNKQSRGFAIVGPSIWNKLSQFLSDLFPITSDQLRKHLKSSYLSVKKLTRVGSDSDPVALYKYLIIITITVDYNKVFTAS